MEEKRISGKRQRELGLNRAATVQQAVFTGMRPVFASGMLLKANTGHGCDTRRAITCRK